MTRCDLCPVLKVKWGTQLKGSRMSTELKMVSERHIHGKTTHRRQAGDGRNLTRQDGLVVKSSPR